MNAARVCKLDNGVNKTPQFLLFSMAKGGTKTNAYLLIADSTVPSERLSLLSNGEKVFLIEGERRVGRGGGRTLTP